MLLSRGAPGIKFEAFTNFLKELGFQQVDEALLKNLRTMYFNSKDGFTYDLFREIMTPNQKEYQLLLNCRKG